MRNFMKYGLAVVALAAATATSAQAQSASPAPWRAWMGCWSAGPVSPLGADPAAPVVCITPTANSSAVQLTTLSAGKVTGTQVVDASGRETPIAATGCTGTQTGRWSGDARRVYLNATVTCDGATHTTSGILAMTTEGDWLDVQGVKGMGDENVRVVRYRDVGVRSTVPAEIAESLKDMGMSVQAARAVASADVGSRAVIDAANATGVAVTEAFILERGQRFNLDARELVSLADAGVSPRLTDAMIAVSNPQTFAVNHNAVPVDTIVTGRRVYATMDRYASPWGWGYSPYGYPRYGYGYGYDSFYNGYGSGYGYGYGYPGYVYSGPVVIVRGSDATAAPHGRMVKGRGYQAGDRAPTQDRAASRAPSPSSESAPRSTSSGSSSSGASSSSSGERTAKPRP